MQLNYKNSLYPCLLLVVIVFFYHDARAQCGFNSSGDYICSGTGGMDSSSSYQQDPSAAMDDPSAGTGYTDPSTSTGYTDPSITGGDLSGALDYQRLLLEAQEAYQNEYDASITKYEDTLAATQDQLDTAIQNELESFLAIDDTTTSDGSVIDSGGSIASGEGLLFCSGFDNTTINPPSGCWSQGCWQTISGPDWPPDIGVSASLQFQLLAQMPVTSSTIDDVMQNKIVTVTGHDGQPTQALYQEISQKKPGCCTQNPLIMQTSSDPGDTYISFWMKYPPDLETQLNGTWKAVWEFKTAGDYRTTATIVTRDGKLQWRAQADNNANGGLPPETYWTVYDDTIPVKTDEWFKFEVFWHRSSDNDGRIWMAVDGQTLVDKYGPNMGVNDKPVNRIMMPNLYSGGSAGESQMIDDIQIWDRIPPADAGDSCS